VDVRILVPGSSDIILMQALSRAAYRPLLEAGVRIFEWNGPMIHAKSAVSDGHWARIGSTNLNIASWIGNCELDVVVEDEEFAQKVAEMYEEDLQHSTEIVLGGRYRVRATNHPEARRPRSHQARGSAGSINRTAAGAIGIGSAIGAAITSRRALGPAEATILVGAGLALLALALIALFFPRVITIPLALIGGWLAVALLSMAYKLRAEKRAATGGLPAHGSKAHSSTRRDNEQ
jgi:cardiolipin synthase